MLVLGDREFLRIVSFVQENYGINLAKKRALIQSRLALDIERRGYPSFAAYVNYILEHPLSPECQHMIDRLSTNHTYFFREPACFEHLCGQALPGLLRRGARQIDIWCAATATGQECYTLAMLLREALAPYGGVICRILGSDVSQEALMKAQAGVYPNEELAHIPTRFHKRCCLPQDDGHFVVAQELKDMIVWKQLNLVQPFPFMQPFHFIFCRNVMIYFDAEAKEALTSELYRLIQPGGFVYVGSTETLDMQRTRFRYLGPSIFERKEATA